MKILSLLLVFAMLLSFAACGTEQPPADTTDPADTAETTPAETTPAETEPPVIPTGPWKEAFEVTSEDGSYTLSFSEPSVVVQGDEGDTAWGHYTFPGLAMTKDGFIICSWHYGNDDIKYTATSGSRMTVNQGKSWMMTTMLDSAAPTRLMKDGNYFQGFVGKGAYRVTYWNVQKHAFFYGN